MLILGLKRLKGLHVCYAICYLFKKLKSFASIEFHLKRFSFVIRNDI